MDGSVVVAVVVVLAVVALAVVWAGRNGRFGFKLWGPGGTGVAGEGHAPTPDGDLDMRDVSGKNITGKGRNVKARKLRGDEDVHLEATPGGDHPKE